MDPNDRAYLTKHRRIINAIATDIQENRLKPYDRLPSEKELCEQWHASRSTVRKAMDHLTDHGKIFRVPGKGSFVSFPKISHQTSQILSFTEKMKAQGLEVETRLLAKKLIRPDDEIVSALKLSKNARVLMIQRLRIVKGEPLALQTAFMPASICEDLLGEDLETKSLNLLLRERCGIRLSRSDVWIEAPVISRREQIMLGDPQVPLFLAIVGITFDQDGRPVRYSRGVFRGDRVRMKISDIGLFELDYAHLLD